MTDDDIERARVAAIVYRLCDVSEDTARRAADEILSPASPPVRALAGLRTLHEYILSDDEPSGADTCAVLYELLGDLGMVVP